MEVKHYEPRPHQKVAFEFLMNTRHAALFAVPGMGKTSVVLMLLDMLQLCGSNFFPVLVIAPKRVASIVWPTEAKQWDAFRGLKVVPILGDVKDREDALLRRGDIYVINYDNVPWLVDRLGEKRWFFKIVIADESTRLKNYRCKKGGKRAQKLSTIVDKVGRWINLTGTPTPNGLKDLWGQLWFLDRGQRLGSTYTKFMERWFRANQYTGEIEPLPNAEKEIYAAIADITMALRAEDWMDVTKPQFNKLEIELPVDARKAYDRMEDEFFAEIGDREIEAVNAMVKSMKLVQMASGAVYDSAKAAVSVHELKLDALENLMEDMAGENVMVVYHFKFDIARVKSRFPGARLMETEQDADDWNAGKIRMLLVHAKSAGHGLNLQHGGRTVAFLTNTWDLELRQQVIERLGPTRQAQAGYNRVVLVYDIIARDTIDEIVLTRLSGKASVQDALMAARAKRKGEVYVPTARDTQICDAMIAMREPQTDVSDLF